MSGRAIARDASTCGIVPPVKTRTVDVVDDYSGTLVADPYRWLEDGDADEVRAWTAEQNAITAGVVGAIPERAGIAARLTELLEVGSMTPPMVCAAKEGVRRYFHQRRRGSEAQPILYVREGRDGADRALLDPAALSPDATTALDWWYPSNDGALVAWGRSDAGSEDSTLFIRDAATGRDLADRIPHTRHASVAWLPDSSGFFYTRYPSPGDVPDGDEKYGSLVFFHKLGDAWTNDESIFGEGRDKLDVPSVAISPNGRWLVVRVHRGWDESEVYVRDLTTGAWTPIAVALGANFEPFPFDDRLLLLTNDGASRYRLLAVDYTHASRDAWTEVVGERDDVLFDVAVSRDSIVLGYLRDASTRLERFALDGSPIGPIALPAIGTASVHAGHDDTDVFIGFTSFTTPFEVLRFDTNDDSVSTWDRIGRPLADVDVSLRFAVSKDGTRIPMFVVVRRGTMGPSPTILYGYGGFNAPTTPAFSSRAQLFVERGGVWVSAVLRGGGEYGETWHRAGMLESKQNVFDDFAACAETLIRDGVTSTEKLALLGGSNGGLLVAALATQRPDLFRVGVSLVPLTDMLRYHRFRIAKLWISEYGSPDDPTEFPFLYAYSPYHRAVDGTRYPSMLFATGDSDSRVDPLHARKMAARMQAAQGDDSRPILLRVEASAGHGAGKPLAKVVEESSDFMAFLMREVGMGST
jgi:prolyl oligopeptidase